VTLFLYKTASTVARIGKPLEAAGEEQHEEDNDHYPDEPRGCIAIRMIAKIRQSAHEKQN
jgi:hypothetical protein